MAARRRRSGRMGWTCCGGSGSSGRSACRGMRRPGPRRGISSGGCKWREACPAALASSGRRGAVPPGCAASAESGTGKAPPGPGYAPATVAHCETVARGFYEFHLRTGTGPMVNPFPLARGRSGRRRARTGTRWSRSARSAAGLYRPKVAGAGRGRSRMRSSASCSRRWARTGTGHWWRSGCRPGCARRSCSARPGDADPGQQLITVVRKGPGRCSGYRPRRTRSCGCGCIRRRWPAWCRPGGTSRCGGRCAARSGRWLSRCAPDVHPGQRGAGSELDAARPEAHGCLPDGARSADAADRRAVGTGHAHLSTTELYMSPLPEDVIAGVLAFHRRRRAAGRAAQPGAAGYRAESLNVLFGPGQW